MISIECPICYDEFNEESIMMCPIGGHPNACAYCLSRISSNNCSICRREVFDSNEDSNDEPIDYFDESNLVERMNQIVIAPNRMVNNYEMTGIDDSLTYDIIFSYEVHFNREGIQEEVYLVNQSGRSLQSGKRLFYYEDNPDMLILKDEEFVERSATYGWFELDYESIRLNPNV